MSRAYTLHARPEAKNFARRRPGLSPRQQAVYRKLVENAWRAVSAGRLGRDYLSKDRWYREVLRDKLGIYTSKQLNKTGDFERACAAFEEIAGDSIYWQMRVNAAPLERMRRKLRELTTEHAIEESYIAGISRQMFDTHPSNLKPDQLKDLIAALKIHFKRSEGQNQEALSNGGKQ